MTWAAEWRFTFAPRQDAHSLRDGFVGWKEALDAVITLSVSGLVVDTTMEGGVTRLNATGAYTGEQRTVLYSVVSCCEV